MRENSGIFAIKQIDAVLESDTAHVQPSVPQSAFCVCQGKADEFRYLDGALLAVASDDQSDAAADFELHVSRSVYGFAFVLLVQHVVGGDVIDVFELGDFESGHFQYVFRLPQRVAGHVGNLHHFLTERVYRNENSAAAFHLAAGRRLLFENHSAFVCRYEQRVADFDSQPVFVRHLPCFGDSGSDEIRNGFIFVVPCEHVQQYIYYEAEYYDGADDENDVARYAVFG